MKALEGAAAYPAIALWKHGAACDGSKQVYNFLVFPRIAQNVYCSSSDLRVAERLSAHLLKGDVSIFRDLHKHGAAIFIGIAAELVVVKIKEEIDIIHQNDFKIVSIKMKALIPLH